MLRSVADIYLLRGRVKFIDPRGKAQHTPFSLMLVIIGATADQKRRYAELVPGSWMACGVAADGMITGQVSDPGSEG